jgi:hypothetical protein
VDAVPAATPADYRFHEVTTALNGFDLGEGKLVEARMGDRDVFGAIADTYDSAEKIVQAVATTHKVKRSLPPILCGKPFVTREVKAP